MIEASGLRKIVIRLHSITTEDSVIHRQGYLDNANPPETESLLDTIEDTDDLLSTYDVAAFVMHFFQNSMMKPWERISDSRLRHIDLSLGMWMLKIAGLVPGWTTAEEAEEQWRVIQELYHLYTRGQMDAKDRQQFQAETQRLRDYVLQQADVIVSTCTNAATGVLYKNF